MPQVHFEIFRQQGRGGGWTLVEACENRITAIDQAKDLFAQGRASAVKVVKETFQPDTGDYMSLTIFEDGTAPTKKKKKKASEDDENPLPCFCPDDLYNYHARMTIARLVGDWLARQRLTVTELLHSAAALEKFEATGTTYQHAIQKIAVAEASESEMPVSQIVKQLNELCTTAIHRVYKDEKHNVFPIIEAGGFAALAKKLAAGTGGAYILNGALAKYLANARGWDDKLQRLLALMPEIAPEGKQRALLLGAIDTLVAEMLNGAAALADLLGRNPDLGHALVNLTQLFLGEKVETAEGTGEGINHLAGFFAKDELPNARSAIAHRILTELRGMKRLSPSSLEDELKMLRRLANRLVRGQGKYLSHEDLIGAFTDRSKRLVTHEPLAQFLQSAKTGDEKVDRLLTVEENIIGAENKRTLATFIMPIITSNTFEEQISAGAPPAQRLKRAAELQERVLRAGFQDVQKNQIASAIDMIALRIERRSGLLAALHQRLPNPVERAQAILKCWSAGLFTQGELSTKAKRYLFAALGKPGFLTGYVNHIERERNVPMDRAQVLTDLVEQLERIGIAPEEGIRAVAA